MKKVLKILLWLLVIVIVGYLAFGKSKKEVVAPTPEMTGGVGGERAEFGNNFDSTIEINQEVR